RSATLSRSSNTSPPSQPYLSLRRTQQFLRSPSPPSRLVTIPETEFSNGTINDSEIVSNN
uniref:Movement protein n=1 Tax=Elaeophora elaphi TaxID=1147741 RepID=A0A0R3RZX4_9BILA